ncbi:MAG: superinfection immunity protein [Sinobacterium sp.]|nr:superinfection immunity protein [Sinobacterium sp.]
MQTEHIPSYLAGATSDPLMTVVIVILIVSILIGGVLYFKLHAIPEKIAHGKNHTQMQLIAILTVLALFTHNNIFWVAALVLAVVEVPNIMTPLQSIAQSLEVIAKRSEASSAPVSAPSTEDASAGNNDKDAENV